MFDANEKRGKKIVPVSFRLTQRSQSNFPPVPVEFFRKDYLSDTQVDQNISVNFQAHCPSQFLRKVVSQSNFEQFPVPDKYFAQVIVPVNFLREILAQSIFQLKNCGPVNL